MAGQADSDGPFLRDALDRAEAIDNATSTGERRKAWVRFVPSMLLAFLEDYVREKMLFGVVLLSVFVAIFGLEADEAWAGIVGVVAAVAGTIAVFVPVVRRSAFRHKWAAIGAVVCTDTALLITFWRWA